MTLRQFLEKWLAHIKPNVAPLTHQRYEELALKNIAPLLGEVMLSKLQPIQISGAYAKAVAEGRRDSKGGLSPRTVRHMHRFSTGISAGRQMEHACKESVRPA